MSGPLLVIAGGGGVLAPAIGAGFLGAGYAVTALDLRPYSESF